MVTKGRKAGTMRFVCNTDGPARQVFIMGDFTDWKPVKMRKQKDGFVKIIALSPGTYEYKYQIDGHWLIDRDNKNFRTNAFGTLNSVISV